MRIYSLLFMVALSTVSLSQIFPIPYFEDFESFVVSNDPHPGTEPFALQNGWTNTLTDDGQDWFAYSDTAQFNPFFTGPSGDHTTGSGVFLYLNDDFGDNDFVELLSPGVNATNVTGGLELSFWIHSQCINNTSQFLLVEASNDQSNWVQVDSILGLTFSDEWQYISIDIKSFIGDTIYFKFTGSSPNIGWKHDFAIDDIRIEEKPFEASLIRKGVTCYGDTDGWMTFQSSFGVDPISVSWSTGPTTDTIFNLTPGIYCATLTDANINTLNLCDTIFEPDTLGFSTSVINHVCYEDSMGSAFVDSVWGGWTITDISSIALEAECSSSPVNIVLDTGTHLPSGTAYPAVFGNWYKSARNQFLYRSNELLNRGLQAGLITHLGIPIESIGQATTDYYNFNVRIGRTSNSALSNQFDSTLALVYSTPLYNVTGDTAWIYFQIPFYWNGSDNLILETCFDNRDYTYTRNIVTYQTATDFRSSLYLNSDGTLTCDQELGLSFSNQSYRPNIIFGNCSSDFSVNQYHYLWSTTDTTSFVLGELWSAYHQVTVSDILGCSVIDSVLITSNDSTGMQINNLANGRYCHYDSYIADAGPGFESYYWSTGDSTQTTEISTDGTYYVVVKDSVGCFSSDTIDVTQYPIPNVSWNVDNEMFGNDGAIDLTVYAGWGPYTYEWSNGETTEDISNLTAGIYQVIVNNAADCKDTSEIEVISLVSLEELGIELHAYPNPSKDIFVLEGNLLNMPISFELFDISGRRIEQFNSMEYQRIEFNLAARPKGIYFLKFQVGGEIKLLKLVRE